MSTDTENMVSKTASKRKIFPVSVDQTPSREIVVCQRLSKIYISGEIEVKALDSVDLMVTHGEFVCLCGPSGSGKSTLLNLIGGLDTPTAGSVAIAGQALEGLDKDRLAELRLYHVGIVFQAYNLIPVLSAQENVEMVLQVQGVPKAERESRARDALGSVGLGDMADRRPGELSGGQQQRVAVARAMASRPKLVLADEPTANLDSKTSESLLELMRDLNSTHGMTFVLSTHDPQVMSYAGRVVRLCDGRLEADEQQ
ncbi:ABC transporter ATP-binding protein [Vreelandella titanicae]|uniref:ABC transporter ATP-binding protein n=1 Tax=Vreelandella titanicae TaxID=664683 RepID=UPI00241EFF9D|nr:ABC transporter ATP-binding protein [Halomonas titanicae]UEQ05317.1 ABC transporter ATP-binding protein [Halomonas profundus]